MDQLTLSKLKEELPGVFPAVVAYAITICRTKPWFNGTVATISGAARELALDAVDRTLRETRPWKAAKVPLGAHLYSVVDSLASNWATAAETRAARFAALDPAETDRSADASVRRPATPEEFYLSREACDAIEADAYEAAGSDPILEKFVEAVADGHFDISEICRVTGLTSEEVYASKRKLKARRKAITPRYQS